MPGIVMGAKMGVGSDKMKSLPLGGLDSKSEEEIINKISK